MPAKPSAAAARSVVDRKDTVLVPRRRVRRQLAAAKSRAISCIACCSAVSSKSNGRRRPTGPRSQCTDRCMAGQPMVDRRPVEVVGCSADQPGLEAASAAASALLGRPAVSQPVHLVPPAPYPRHPHAPTASARLEPPPGGRAPAAAADLIQPLFVLDGKASASRSPRCRASSGCRSTCCCRWPSAAARARHPGRGAVPGHAADAQERRRRARPGTTTI